MPTLLLHRARGPGHDYSSLRPDQPHLTLAPAASSSDRHLSVLLIAGLHPDPDPNADPDG